MPEMFVRPSGPNAGSVPGAPHVNRIHPNPSGLSTGVGELQPTKYVAPGAPAPQCDPRGSAGPRRPTGARAPSTAARSRAGKKKEVPTLKEFEPKFLETTPK